MTSPAPAPARVRADARGRRAEVLAAWWLRLHGWRILGRRVRTHAIEVDLVARRGRTLALVEVKHRATLDAALAAIHGPALARLHAAARQLAATRPGFTVRVDLVAVAPGRWPRHLANL